MSIEIGGVQVDAVSGLKGSRTKRAWRGGAPRGYKARRRPTPKPVPPVREAS